MTPKAARRNAKRYAKQLLDYVEPQVDTGKTVSLGIIFSKKPSSPERLRLVECLFEEIGIPVVWEDEAVEERRKRSNNS